MNSRTTFNEQKTLKRRASQKAIEKDYKGDLILQQFELQLEQEIIKIELADSIQREKVIQKLEAEKVIQSEELSQKILEAGTEEERVELQKEQDNLESSINKQIEVFNQNANKSLAEKKSRALQDIESKKQSYAMRK